VRNELRRRGASRRAQHLAAENGEVLRTNRSAVAHWVAGTAPGERTAAYLAEALSRRAGRPVTPQQIGLAASPDQLPSGAGPAGEMAALARADVDHQGFLAAAVYTTVGASLPLGYDHEPVARLLRVRSGRARVGAAEVAVVRQVTQAFGAADELLGGGHGLSAVAAYLADTAVPLLSARFPSEQSRRGVRRGGRAGVAARLEASRPRPGGGGAGVLPGRVPARR
jgi:hypothetical protein